jgi:hypothetical protein
MSTSNLNNLDQNNLRVHSIETTEFSAQNFIVDTILFQNATGTGELIVPDAELTNVEVSGTATINTAEISELRVGSGIYAPLLSTFYLEQSQKLTGVGFALVSTNWAFAGTTIEAWYSRINQVVHLSGIMQIPGGITSIGDPSLSVRITGVPFGNKIPPLNPEAWGTAYAVRKFPGAGPSGLGSLFTAASAGPSGTIDITIVPTTTLTVAAVPYIINFSIFYEVLN